MNVKIYQTEDKKHFALAKIDNNGKYDEKANCSVLEINLPEEIEIRSWAGGKPEPVVKESGDQAYFTEVYGRLVVKTLVKTGRTPKMYPVEIFSETPGT